jgi:hypothetical protein
MRRQDSVLDRLLGGLLALGVLLALGGILVFYVPYLRWIWDALPSTDWVLGVYGGIPQWMRYAVFGLAVLSVAVAAGAAWQLTEIIAKNIFGRGKEDL